MLLFEHPQRESHHIWDPAGRTKRDGTSAVREMPLSPPNASYLIFGYNMPMAAVITGKHLRRHTGKIYASRGCEVGFVVYPLRAAPI
jgi:hypothetical protein